MTKDSEVINNPSQEEQSVAEPKGADAGNAAAGVEPGVADATDTAAQADEAAETVDSASAAAQGEVLSSLYSKLEQVAAESNAHRERYLRSVADLENFRKRALREKDDVRRSAICSIVEDLLPVLDNFSLGLQAAEAHEGGKAFADGFQMILTQLRNVLKDNGVEEIQPLQAPFDPNFHESLGSRADPEIAEGHVIEVQRVGYRIQERLIRPAAVIVSSGPQAGAANAAGQEEV